MQDIAASPVTDAGLRALLTVDGCADAVEAAGVTVGWLRDVTGAAGAAVVLVEGDRLRVAAADGIAPAVGEVVSAGPRSHARFVLDHEGPVVSADVRAERRFLPCDLTLRAGVGAAASARAGAAGFVAVHGSTPGVVPDGWCVALADAAAALSGWVVPAPALVEVVAGAGGATPLSIFVVDVDGTGRVNADHGRSVGDGVLRRVAARLARVAGSDDAVHRLAGDEFAVVVPGVSAADALRLAERAVGAVEATMDVDGRAIGVSACVGVATATVPTPAAALAERATLALSDARAAGRGRVRLSRPLGPTAAAPGVSRVEVDAAVAGVRAVFQPIVRAHDHALAGVEALTRGPAGGALERPDLLFAAADAEGRLPALEMAAKAAALGAELPAGLPVFVNLDPSVVVDPTWIPRLAELWARLAPARPLVVELTERCLTDQPRDLLRAVDQIRAQGWRVALDDLGARDESLTVLRLVRPDVVKLDMSLVRGVSPMQAASVTTALAGYRERHPVPVIAEGIESVDDERMAEVLGATHLQGFALGRPVPAGEVDVSRPGDGITGWDPCPGATVERIATKARLLFLSRYIETVAVGADHVVLGALQHRRHYTERTRRQYERLARRCGFAGVLGAGLESGVDAGVRTAALADDDPLVRVWQVVTLSVTGGVALLAEELEPALPAEELRPALLAEESDNPPGTDDADRLFRYRITADHDEVAATADALLRRF